MFCFIMNSVLLGYGVLLWVIPSETIFNISKYTYACFRAVLNHDDFKNCVTWSDVNYEDWDQSNN